jgi:hypothetical protein
MKTSFSGGERQVNIVKQLLVPARRLTLIAGQ